MSSSLIDKKDYDELQSKYDKLERKYNKLNSRIHSMMKINDRTMKTIFNKNISIERSNKRLKVIMKQSDKDGKRLLILNENKTERLLEQSKMASMGKMIENISHQMKQPLSLIMTSATALELQKELNMLSDKDFSDFISRIVDSTEYLSETIDNFKNFFQDDKIKKELDLTEIIIKSKRLLETKFEGTNIKIVHDLDDIVFMGISNELIQVITNLLSNSIDAMENMKIDKFIFITSLFKDDKVVIEFKDTGGGIKEDIMGNIFDTHFTTKGKNKGSGIGLDMSRMIIEDTFRGSINVNNETFNHNSNIYYGACFTIVLPLYKN